MKLWGFGFLSRHEAEAHQKSIHVFSEKEALDRKTGEHGKRVCPISVPSHHLESKGVLHNTFTRTQGFVHGKIICTFETSPNICFSVSSLRSRILDTFQQIEAVADSFAWLKSYSSNNHDFSVDNGIVSFTKGVKFRINHAYGRLLGKVICGQVDKNMAIYGNDDKHSWDAVNRWKTVDRISNKTPPWQLWAARS